MTEKSLYDIGQEVFYIKDDRVRQGVISSISIEVLESKEKIVRYAIRRNGSELYAATDKMREYNSEGLQAVFGSKMELLASL